MQCADNSFKPHAVQTTRHLHKAQIHTQTQKVYFLAKLHLHRDLITSNFIVILSLATARVVILILIVILQCHFQLRRVFSLEICSQSCS